MFAPTYTYEQLYAVYHRGFHPTRHLIEDLLGTLAEWEQILDTSRRRAVEGLQARSRKLEAQLARSKAESARREHEAYVLRRRVQELQQELARRDDQARRDAAVAAAAAGDIRGAARRPSPARRRSRRGRRGRHPRRGGRDGGRAARLAQLRLAAVAGPAGRQSAERRVLSGARRNFGHEV